MFPSRAEITIDLLKNKLYYQRVLFTVKKKSYFSERIEALLFSSFTLAYIQ